MVSVEKPVEKRLEGEVAVVLVHAALQPIKVDILHSHRNHPLGVKVGILEHELHVGNEALVARDLQLHQLVAHRVLRGSGAILGPLHPGQRPWRGLADSVIRQQLCPDAEHVHVVIVPSPFLGKE